MSDRSPQGAARVLGLALLYFVVGRLGLMIPAFGSHITLVWLPTGIAVAALLRFGPGCWPGVALGALAVNFGSGLTWPAVLGIAVGNTAGPLLAAHILRWTGFHTALDRNRDFLLLAVAAVIGMLVPASLGVPILASADSLKEGWLAAWLIWWAGDSMGVIAAAPLVLSLTRAEWRRIASRRGEFLIWIATTCCFVFVVFVMHPDLNRRLWAPSFLTLPLVAWAALRFGTIGTSLGIIILSAAAAYGTATGRGPFSRTSPNEAAVVLWLYMATCAVLGWLIAALHAARLKASGMQHLLEQALSDVSLGVLLSGLDRKITSASVGFTRLTGYTEAEMRGQSCRRLQGSGTDPAVAEKLRIALHGDGFFDDEILNYRKDGTPFWNGLLISPVHNERGEMTGFIGIQRDITRRKEAEEALRTAGQMRKLHFEQTPMAVIEWNLEFRVTQWNPAAQTIFGFSRDEALGQHASFIVPERYREQVDEVWEALLKKTGGERSTNGNVRKDGTTILCEWYNTPLVDGRGTVVGVASLVMDITERKRAEEEIRALNAALERRVEERTAELHAANKELETFSYSVSHDLKAPLRAVDGLSHILAKNYAERLDAEGRELIGLLRNAAQRMARLIEDLLAFSQIARRPLRRSPVNMHALAQAVFDELSALEPGRKLRLVLHALPPASGTEPMIRQVWANLIGNAIKFTKKRDVGEIEIGVKDDGGEPIYYVRDNGAGFDMQYAEKLFGVFQRLHSADEFEGTGIGLALVARVVQRHGGRAWAEAALDRGATFYFTLPALKQ